MLSNAPADAPGGADVPAAVSVWDRHGTGMELAKAREEIMSDEIGLGSTANETRQVNPWKFAGGFLEKVLSARIPAEPQYADIPWIPVSKKLSESKVALLSTAGLSMKGDTPFDMDFERQNPTRGDSTWRRLRGDATAASIEANHLHIDTSYVLRDLNVALPLDRLRELADEGIVGAMAESHYSTMGYQGNDSTELEQQSAPAIAEAMKSEEVDLALLAPV
jgi:D-proline reductase (dithiol) PrdB